MASNIKSMMKHKSFWLSLACHLLLFLALTVSFILQPKPLKPEPKPKLYVQSYVYQPPVQAMQMSKQSSSKNEKERTKLDDNKGDILKPTTDTTGVTAASTPAQVAPSRATEQPIHMIGDKKTSKPLIKILGRAITSHLIYPRIAMDFNVRGRALIGFTLHPDGHVTGARVVESSGAEVLDNAALSSINAISPVKEVGPYVSAPKYLVVGIIFG